VVDLEGASRGLVVLWDPWKWRMVLFSKIMRILMMSFAEIGTQTHGLILNVYGMPMPHLKRGFLESLLYLGGFYKAIAWSFGVTLI